MIYFILGVILGIILYKTFDYIEEKISDILRKKYWKMIDDYKN